MTEKAFFQQLSLTIIAAMALLLAIDYFLPASSQWFIAFGLLAAMVAVTLAIFYSSKKALKNPKPQVYIANFIRFSAVKIVVCLVCVIIYKNSVDHVDKNFILTFLSVYVVFMIFETHVFMKLSRG